MIPNVIFQLVSCFLSWLTLCSAHIYPCAFTSYLGVGLISGAAVIIVLSLVIAIIVAITCCLVKRKARKLLWASVHVGFATSIKC